VRVWDLPPQRLCRQHLLGQHNEIHALWSVITGDRAGYANHPETKRWRGRLLALHARHESTAEEMLARGYRHQSALPEHLATGSDEQCLFVDSVDEQLRLLHAKGCDCDVC
jgi:hypothetical protein